MLFNSLEFLVFFPTVVALYFATPHRYRWALLLLASYYFYACWKLEYLALIAGSTLVDYFAGIRMGKTDEKRARKKYLVFSIVANLGILFAFKYFNFFSESARRVFSSLNIFFNVPLFEVLLPVGISFYTFQSLSYSIDVYRGKRPPEKHLGIFALYVSFFPQLVAGPIERSTRLLPQFYEKKRFDWDRMRSGLLLVLWGFFKKVVIADRVAVYVNQIFSQPGDYSGLPIIIAMYFFAFQLYCDFSAYSDIAIGTARVMGYDLMLNFRRPFVARTLREFWQRWHISLTRWFMDYLYFPIAKRCPKTWQKMAAIFGVFVIIGLWHGAAWNFVLFGTIGGLAFVVGEATRPYRAKFFQRLFAGKPTLKRMHGMFQIMFVFHLYVLGSTVFRVNWISDISVILSNLFQDITFSVSAAVLPRFSGYELSVAVIAILILQMVEWLNEQGYFVINRIRQSVVLRWSTAYALIYTILMFGEFNLTPFIYFQF